MLRALLKTTLPLLALACFGPLTAQGQQSHCRPADGESEALVAYARMLAAPENDKLAATAEAYGIPATPVTDVEHLTDENLCRRAARSFAQELGEHGPFERRVHLVRIGTERKNIRYLVTDPDHRMGEYEVVVVFDQRFQRLASFTR